MGSGQRREIQSRGPGQQKTWGALMAAVNQENVKILEV